MRISRALVLLTATIALVGATWIYAQQRKPGSHVLLSPEDYIEIHQLYSFYTRDVDPGSARDASWMFTTDGTAQMGERRYTGQKDLQEFYSQVRKNQAAGVRHFNSSYVIVGTPEGARGSSYMMGVERKGEGKPIEVTLFGKYEDRLVKTRDGWRIKERIWTPDSFRGSTQPVSPSPIPGQQ
jgi:SnoaL-like protein